MLNFVIAGGWLMLPILACSLVAFAIVIERFWNLNHKKICPSALLSDTWQRYKDGDMTVENIVALRQQSPLGEVFAAGFANQTQGREVMKNSMEEAGSKIHYELERFLAALSTIANIAPLLGLLGTVIGMIEVFSEIMISGTGNAPVLAGGISQALITTASGLTVAIPAMIFHRFFERRIDAIVVDMEQQSSRLVDAIFSSKEVASEQDDSAATNSTSNNN